MVIFILSFRSQNLAIKEAAYQKVLDDYTTSINMIIDRPELGSMMQDIGRALASEGVSTESISEKDRVQFAYMLFLYSLFERIYLLHDKKWIGDDDWNQWHTWMKTMAKHPMFQEVHRRSQGTFDREFQDLIGGAVTKAPSDRASMAPG